MTMAVFKETTGKDFLEKYDGKEMFKQYTPKIGKLPSLAYRPFYDKKAGDVVGYCVGKGLCTEAEAAALEAAFNEKYAD